MFIFLYLQVFSYHEFFSISLTAHDEYVLRAYIFMNIWFTILVPEIKCYHVMMPLNIHFPVARIQPFHFSGIIPCPW